MNPVSSASRGRGRAQASRLALVGLLGLGLFVTPARPAQAQVSVEELEVHLQLARQRAPMTQVIPVKNDERRAQQVRVSLGDWVRDSLGNNVFLEANTTATSCGSRLQVFPQTFQIAPGATELVRVAYEPTPADSGCWSIVFIETVTPPPARPDGQGSFLTIEIRTGVKVYVHRPDALRGGNVLDAVVEQVWRLVDPMSGRLDSVHVREVHVTYVNSGTAHARVKATLEVRATDARLLHAVPAGEFPMTPGATRLIPIRLPDLPSGDYVAIVLLDYGGDDVTAAQIDFRIP